MSALAVLGLGYGFAFLAVGLITTAHWLTRRGD